MSLADIQKPNNQVLYGKWVNILPITASTGNIVSTPSNSIFIGTSAGNSTLTGNSNNAIGEFAGSSLTTGSRNDILGYRAGRYLTTGTDNCFIGSQAGMNVTTSSNNTYLGGYAGESCFGVDNVAVGTSALRSTAGSSHEQSVAVGYEALSRSLYSRGDVAVGYRALYGVQSQNSFGDIAIGSNCLVNYAAGGSGLNIAIGRQAGLAYTTIESNNIIIGSNNYGVVLDQNTIRLGSTSQNKLYISAANNAITGTVNPLYIDASGQIGVSVSSGKYKTNLVPIKNSEKIHDLVPIEYDLTINDKTMHQCGLLAEHTYKVMPEICNVKDGKSTSIRYHELIPHMIRELQLMKRSLDGVDHDEENTKDMFECYSKVQEELKVEKEKLEYEKASAEDKSIIDQKKYIKDKMSKFPVGLVSSIDV